MKITLKKIRYSEHASQETNNFVADLYVDGKPFAVASNDGVGGCNMYHRHEKYGKDHRTWHEELQNLYDWHKQNTTYETEFDDRGFTEGCLDVTVDEVLEDHLSEKRVKSLTARNMIVFEKGKKGYYKYGKKKYNITADRRGWFNNQMWQLLKDNWVCINDMPLDEAIAYFKANG